MGMIDQNTGNCCINQHAEIIRKIQDTAVSVCMCVCVGTQPLSTYSTPLTDVGQLMTSFKAFQLADAAADAVNQIPKQCEIINQILC